jgi:ubiquinone biosynthesis protein COQ4
MFEQDRFAQLPPLPIPPPARSMKTNWRRAFRALRALLDHPDETQRAMELTLHIGAANFERNFQRFVRSPAGSALIQERPSLPESVANRTALERMSPDSFATAYLAYLDANGFQPTALVELQRETELRWMAETGEPPLDPLRRWFSDRFLICHDLFHVLTGYGTDSIGEATLLAFALAQQGGNAGALLTVGAAAKPWQSRGLPWLRYDLRAWRRGRRAAWLPGQPWEELLPLRLETVKVLLRVEPEASAHPGGILRDEIDPADAPAAA